LEVKEFIFAYGHKNILAIHRTTLQITKEERVSRRGDCIIAVSADKSVADLSPEFKENLRKEKAKITVLIEAGDSMEVVNAFGSPKLILTHPTDMVVRKSNYICSRTLAIRADKAAYDMPKKLGEKLKDPKQRLKITINVKV